MPILSDYDRAVAAMESGNYEEVRKLAEPMARSGHAGAQCLIASLYHLGLGVEAHGESAVYWYRLAGGQNERSGEISGLAYHNLATLYATGMPGVDRNVDEARRYLNLARELGFSIFRSKSSE